MAQSGELQPHVEELVQNKYDNYVQRRRDTVIRDGMVKVPCMSYEDYRDNYRAQLQCRR